MDQLFPGNIPQEAYSRPDFGSGLRAQSYASVLKSGSYGGTLTSDDRSTVISFPHGAPPPVSKAQFNQGKPLVFRTGPAPRTFPMRPFAGELQPDTLEDALDRQLSGPAILSGRVSPRHEFDFFRGDLGHQLRVDNSKYNSRTMGQMYLSGLVSGKRILLLGSGCGRSLLSLFKNEPAEVVCLDTSASVLRRVMELAAEANCTEFVRVVNADAYDASVLFSPESFDCVACVKSLGQIFRGTGPKDMKSLLASWSALLRQDGVLLVDVQTFVDRAETFGTPMASLLPPDSEELEVATFGGRYQDTAYSLMATPGFGCELTLYWVPVPRLGPQEWAQYWFTKVPKPVSGIRNTSDPVTAPVLSDLLPPVRDMVSHVAYPSVLPSEAKGVKLWLTGYLARRVATKKIYPKFDGQSAVVYFRGTRAVIMAERVIATVDLAEEFGAEVAALVELVRVESGSPGTEGRTVGVITGVLSVGGSTVHSVHDMEMLATLGPKAGVLGRSGFVVTSPKHLLNLRGNFARLAYMMPTGVAGYVSVPVDGLNVPLGGSHGHFVKPHPLSTMDVRHRELGDLPLLLSDSLGLDFVPEFGGVPWDADSEDLDSVWEYASRDGGRTWRAVKPRFDKVKTVTFNRAVRDLMGAFKGFQDAPGVDTVAKMYAFLSLVDRRRQ